MTPLNKKITLIILLSCMLLTIFCGNDEKNGGTGIGGALNTEYVGMTGTTQKPDLTVQTDKDYEAASGSGGSLNKKAAIKVDLPLAIWKEFEYRMLSTGKQLGETNETKQQFCMVHIKDSTPLEKDIEVEVIDEATCNWSRFVGTNGIPRILEIGLLKIKVKSTGEEGWVFKQAVNINN